MPFLGAGRRANVSQQGEVRAIQTVSLSFYRFDAATDRLWAFAMMGLARPALRRIPGLEFWKLCGAGTGEGFTPLPDTGVCAPRMTSHRLCEQRCFDALLRCVWN